ncbi:MAG TPA: ribose 5-phosphate isomerase A [Mucilaginibacter sp.]
MNDYKKEAAKAALEFIKPGMAIGLGAGASIAYLVEFLAMETSLANTLTLASSSAKTLALIKNAGLTFQESRDVQHLDIYFDGCDQFDAELNALKSGAGIHTAEKIMASKAQQFILVGDTSKFVPVLTTAYPLVIEVLPIALHLVQQKIVEYFPDAKTTIRTDENKAPIITANGNLLLDVYLARQMSPEKMNAIKMVPRGSGTFPVFGHGHQCYYCRAARSFGN